MLTWWTVVCPSQMGGHPATGSIDSVTSLQPGVAASARLAPGQTGSAVKYCVEWFHQLLDFWICARQSGRAGACSNRGPSISVIYNINHELKSHGIAISHLRTCKIAAVCMMGPDPQPCYTVEKQPAPFVQSPLLVSFCHHLLGGAPGWHGEQTSLCRHRLWGVH